MSYQPSLDLPSPDYPGAAWGEAAQYHTPHREFVYPGRRVLLVPGEPEWEHTPEECPGCDEKMHDEFKTEWFLDNKILVCTGCGLDVS